MLVKARESKREQEKAGESARERVRERYRELDSVGQEIWSYLGNLMTDRLQKEW